MKVKICGLTKIQQVRACVNLKTNFCGFILNYPKSHRFIKFNTAVKLTNQKKRGTKFVGVLVNPSQNDFLKYSQLKIDYFQIYGKFTVNALSKIRAKFNKKIIYTIQVKNKKDIQKYKLFKNCVDIILFDSSGYEKSLSWDFNWIKDVRITKMIAGNIKLTTLDKIYKLADIIDVSGALETNKVKDINKIKVFLKKLRKFN